MRPQKDRAGRLYADVLALFARKQHLDTVQVLLNLFLQARGQPLPSLATVKSPSAISRFLNHYAWNVRGLIRVMRRHALDQYHLHRRSARGRSARLELIVDLTSLRKEGRFEHLQGWVHRFNGVTGVHLVVLYLCCGQLRVPWSFAVWRGKGQLSPATLALRMLGRLPDSLRRRGTAAHVLADAGFSSKAFIQGVVALGLSAFIGIQGNRNTSLGRALRDIKRQGQCVFLEDLPKVPLWLYWVWLPTKQGDQKEQRFIVSTMWQTTGSIKRIGRRRWKIEALFKVLKSRFGLARFGQHSKRGVLRYFCLCLLSFLLCHFEDLEALEERSSKWPDWGELATRIRHKYCGLVRLLELKAEIGAVQAVLDGVLVT